jgi:hypothetical protein
VRLKVGTSFITHQYLCVFARYDSVGMMPAGDLFELQESTIGTVLEVKPSYRYTSSRGRYAYRVLFADGRLGWMISDHVRTVLL